MFLPYSGTIQLVFKYIYQKQVTKERKRALSKVLTKAKEITTIGTKISRTIIGSK